MTEHLMLQLTGIIVLGIGAQWLAWRLRLPAEMTSNTIVLTHPLGKTASYVAFAKEGELAVTVHSQ